MFLHSKDERRGGCSRRFDRRNSERCHPLRVGIVQREVLGGHLGDVHVDDPVHQVEAGEAHGEDDARVLVDGGRRGAVHDVQVLALAHERQIVAICHRCHLHHRAARLVRALHFITEKQHALYNVHIKERLRVVLVELQSRASRHAGQSENFFN